MKIWIRVKIFFGWFFIELAMASVISLAIMPIYNYTQLQPFSEPKVVLGNYHLEIPLQPEFEALILQKMKEVHIFHENRLQEVKEASYHYDQKLICENGRIFLVTYRKGSYVFASSWLATILAIGFSYIATKIFSNVKWAKKRLKEGL